MGNHRVASTFADKCSALVSTLFPLEVPITNEDSFPNSVVTDFITPTTNNSSLASSQWEWPELSLNELLQAVPEKKTAPGNDRIDWSMIKKTTNCLPQFFS